ncbi:hypothetical protein SAMN02982917_2024 [Azospirillum oryzae]|uniref:TrbC/VirB2 family protein n=1 Tax=Azospirillum oryzae TaxID=286727 RepID=A0A1X7ETS3_9PROT|nr:hypothetical protein [Azospirillum oryzae]SMF39985.1 hypothetical protein SAMN02982917_2024 [Azospirillum oryzae]
MLNVRSHKPVTETDVEGKVWVLALSVLCAYAVMTMPGMEAFAQADPTSGIVAKATSGRNNMVTIINAVIGVVLAGQLAMTIMNKADWKWMMLTGAGGAGINTVPAIQSWIASAN